MMQINPSVGQRVILGFVVMILLVGLASGVGLLYSSSANTALNNAHNNSAQINQIRSLQLQWSSVVLVVDNLLLSRQISLIDSQLNPGVAVFNQQLADLQKLDIGQNPAEIAKNKEIIKVLQQLGSNLTGILNQITEYTKTGSWAKAQTLRFTELASLQRRLTENLDRLNLNISKSIDEEIISSTARQNSARAQLISIIVFAVIMSSVLAYFTTRSITLPVAQLLKNVQKIMNRDFSHQEILKRNDEFGKLSQATNLMADLLKENYEKLEQRVIDRTKALATSSEVSRRLSTILNQKELVTEVVNQVKNAFGYYHTQIYFYDGNSEHLVMAGGTGEAGQMMLAQFHKVTKGRGLVGRAAESNQVVLVSDTVKNPEWLPNVLLPDTKSEAAIPISIGDKVLGVLDVQHNIVNGLKPEDVDSLQSIANQIAVAIKNIQSTEIVAKRAAELQTVANISTAAATIGNIDDMLQEVVHLTQRGFGLYHAHIFIYNEDTAELEIAACGYKEGDEHEGTHGTTTISLDQEQSLVARAGRTRQAVIVNDVRSDPGWLPNPILTETASELAVPMIVGDRLLGVLDVQSERVNAFSDEDASIQTTLASQVATALQNARSFSQAQQQAERETTVNFITQKIQNTTSIEAALQIAARELGHALGMKSTLVTLDPEVLAGERKGVLND